LGWGAAHQFPQEILWDIGGGEKRLSPPENGEKKGQVYELQKGSKPGIASLGRRWKNYQNQPICIVEEKKGKPAIGGGEGVAPLIWGV